MAKQGFARSNGSENDRYKLIMIVMMMVVNSSSGRLCNNWKKKILTISGQCRNRDRASGAPLSKIDPNVGLDRVRHLWTAERQHHGRVDVFTCRQSKTRLRPFPWAWGCKHRLGRNARQRTYSRFFPLLSQTFSIPDALQIRGLPLPEYIT